MNTYYEAKDSNFITYYPKIFDCIRTIFNITLHIYEKSFILHFEIFSNPGASDSIFYRTNDKKYMIKSVSETENSVFQIILNSYFIHLNINKNSLLPKFFGYYKLTAPNQFFLVVMNNLFPNNIKIHEKYDLKGSTSNRYASQKEKMKSSPTFKDLDFRNNYERGIFLDKKIYQSLLNIIKKDIKLLKAWNITDYSFLIGIHYVDDNDFIKQKKEQNDKHKSNENSPCYFSPKDGIPAKNFLGKRLLLFVGIIDILQEFNNFKVAEHFIKEKITTPGTTSVQPPDFYHDRFFNFIFKYVLFLNCYFYLPIFNINFNLEMYLLMRN